MCQHQSHQTSNMKSHSIMITHQAHHHENQMSVLALFENLSVNMVSTCHLEEENEEMIQFDIDP